MVELAHRAVPVLRLALAGLERPEHPELALDRRSDRVRHPRHPPGDRDVVVVGGRRLHVRLEAPVHHHAGEPVPDRRETGRLVVAMVLVQAERDLGKHLAERVDHLRQHHVAGIGPRPAARLQDHRRVAGPRRLHDREPLLHVVDVEGRHPVAALRGMVEQLPQRDLRHRFLLSRASRARIATTAAGRDSEMLVERRRRRRGAEAGHPDEAVARPQQQVPPLPDRRFDPDPRRRPEHRRPRLGRPRREALERRRRHHRRRDPARRQRIRRRERDLHLRAGRDQRDVPLAGIAQQVCARARPGSSRPPPAPSAGSAATAPGAPARRSRPSPAPRPRRSPPRPPAGSPSAWGSPAATPDARPAGASARPRRARSSRASSR